MLERGVVMDEVAGGIDGGRKSGGKQAMCKVCKSLIRSGRGLNNVSRVKERGGKTFYFAPTGRNLNTREYRFIKISPPPFYFRVGHR